MESLPTTYPEGHIMARINQSKFQVPREIAQRYVPRLLALIMDRARIVIIPPLEG